MDWTAFYMNQAAEDARLTYERYRIPGGAFNAPTKVPAPSCEGPHQLPPGDTSPAAAEDSQP